MMKMKPKREQKKKKKEKTTTNLEIDRERVREGRQRNVNRMHVYDSGFKLGGIKLFKSNIKISLHFLS